MKSHEQFFANDNVVLVHMLVRRACKTCLQTMPVHKTMLRNLLLMLVEH